MKKSSAKEVAKLAKVSQSTVSRVFTPGKSVSNNTKERVLQAANELDYQPNALARGLITNKSKLIGIAMNETQNPFYYETLTLFTKELKNYGYSVLFVYTENEEIQQEEINHFLEYNVEAIIITDALLSSKLVKKIKSYNIPVILFNRYDDKLDCNSVSSDNIFGGESVAEYFYNKGYKQNLYISGLTDTSTNRDRLYGFKNYFEKKNIKINVLEGDYTFETAFNQTLKYLTFYNKPEGIFAANDITAIGALEALKMLDIAVPEEIEVIGFDDIEMASWPNYKLSTWSQPLNTMIEKAVKILIENDINKIEQRQLKGNIIFRNTTK